MTGKSVLTVCLSPTFQNTLVFGSFNEDEVNRAESSMHIDASGKGLNVLRILGQLGTKATCLTQLGGPRVDEYLNLCRDQNMEVIPVICDAQIRTCTTLINKERGTSTELVENAHPVDFDTDRKIWDEFEKNVRKHDVLVISGTKAPGFSKDIFPRMVKTAKENGLLVVLDVKGDELKACLEYRPDIIKPNLSEFVGTFFEGLCVLENQDSEQYRTIVAEKTDELYVKYGTRTILTRGKFDSWAFDGEKLISVPNPPLSAPVINTIGCGDTMTAGLTHALLQGESFENAIALGMKCAAARACRLNHGL